MQNAPQAIIVGGWSGPERPFVPDVIVPARVNKALEFLQMAALKGMTRAAVNDLSIQDSGQKRTDEEDCTFASACNLLSAYFAGKLPPDEFEQLRIDGSRKALTKKDDRGGTVMMCPSCAAAGRPDKTCELYEGEGHVVMRLVRRRKKR